MICNRSAVFKAAFESKFREGADKVIYFPEIDYTIFDTYIKHVYCGDSYRLVSSTLSDDPQALNEEFV